MHSQPEVCLFFLAFLFFCLPIIRWLSISKSYAEDEPDRASHARELMRLGNGGVTRSKTLADLILVVDHGTLPLSSTLLSSP